MDFGSASTEQLRAQIAMLLADRAMLDFQSDSTFRRLDVDRKGALTLPDVAPLVRKILGISGRVISADEELELWRRHSDPSMHHITALQFRTFIQHLFSEASSGGYPQRRPTTATTVQPSSIAPSPAPQAQLPAYERQSAPTPPIAPPEECWERANPPTLATKVIPKEGTRARSGSRGPLPTATSSSSRLPATTSAAKAKSSNNTTGNKTSNSNNNNINNNNNNNINNSNNSSTAAPKAANGTRGRSSSLGRGQPSALTVTQDARRSPPPPSAARRANAQAAATAATRPPPDILEEAYSQVPPSTQEFIKRAREQYNRRPEIDYFRNCSTILTSLEAAIHRAYKLVQELEGDVMFQDPDFQSDASSLGLEDPRSSPSPLKIDADQVAWLRPTEMMGTYTCGGSSSSSSTCTDSLGFLGPCQGIQTGAFGDGWFASTLGMFLVREDMLFGDETACQEGQKVGVCPRLFWDPALRRRGLYCMRFQKFGQSLYVIIDNRLPMAQRGMEALFSKALSTNRSTVLFWAALIEKAYAKLHSGYGALWSGFPDDALRDLTTFPTEKIPLAKYAAGISSACGMGAVASGQMMGPSGSGPGSKDPNFLWATLRGHLQNGAFVASCHSKKEDGEDPFITVDAALVKMSANVGELPSWSTGLAFNVAYPIVALHEADDGRNFICLRNIVAGTPGSGYWLGRWGPSDEAWKREPKLASTLSSLSVGRGGAFLSGAGSGGGCFWMLFEDWLRVFNHSFLSLPMDENQGWVSRNLIGSWTPETCGGTPIAVKATPPPGTPETWAKNPQCRLVFPPSAEDATASGEDARVEICLVLEQEDARMERGSPFPYQDRLVEIFLCILQADPSEQKLTQFNKKRVVKGGVSLMSKRREVFLRTNLTTPGTYLIVPSTWEVALPNGKRKVPFRLSLHVKCASSRFRIETPSEEGWE